MEEEERQFEVEEMEYEKFLREITAKDDEVPMSVCEINGQDCILFFENANVTK